MISYLKCDKPKGKYDGLLHADHSTEEIFLNCKKQTVYWCSLTKNNHSTSKFNHSLINGTLTLMRSHDQQIQTVFSTPTLYYQDANQKTLLKMITRKAQANKSHTKL